MTDTLFSCHPLGYVRHWLVTGPHASAYAGSPGDENTLRLEALDKNPGEAPSSAVLDGLGPYGKRWQFYYPGENFFVEHSAFYDGLTVIDSYAFTEIECDLDASRDARFWVCGTADLWLNDSHVTRFAVPRYMYPDFQAVTLSFRRGRNRLCVRLQCLGVRDTCVLFGLQVDDCTGIGVRIPGGESLAGRAGWLEGVRTAGLDRVVSRTPAPGEASITIPGGAAIPWPAGISSVELGERRPFRLTVEIGADGQTMGRSLEIPGNRDAGTPVESLPDRRRARLEFIGTLAAGGKGNLPLRKGFLALLARRLLGAGSAKDETALEATLAFIDGRGDCADFALAALLRLEALGLATPSESARIRRTALAFRYWDDEPGNDAMCFRSENHSLLFYGCQLIAGRFYPDDVFSNSKRSGAEQAALGASRCREWIERIEGRGLGEFNSGTYLPITVAALLNVVDFSGDAEMSRRGSALLDRTYEGLALHAFDGVIISPQGRVYRNVLYPEESGAQALLSDATAKAPPDFPYISNDSVPESWTGDWMVYTASSKSYRPPGHLEQLMEEAVSKRHRQGSAEIVIHKTPAYLLTSLAIGGADEAAAGEEEGLRAGMAGYQQHLWQATLARGCHVFVNHPGASFDGSKSRPGYWYGNGVLPRLRQREGVIAAIFNIPDGSAPCGDRTPIEWLVPQWRRAPLPFDLHPVPFTHAHWPSDAFDRQEVLEHWLIGQKGHGCVALWCSETLRPHDEVLTGREYRARGYRCAWVGICGSLAEYGEFESFMRDCLAREPEFDSAALAVRMEGEERLDWGR